MSITLDGVIVYEILPNGCLNGVFSNDHSSNVNHEIFNEIARKVSDLEDHAGDEIFGNYLCSYIDFGNVAEICDLVIQPGYVGKNSRRSQYDLIWYEKGTTNIKFEGSGWRTRTNQITVSYRDL